MIPQGDHRANSKSTTKKKALDLFCGAGGAAEGLHRAGFEVVGVDIVPQPDYPFEFVQADAMTFPIEGYDFILASPPCKRFTSLRRLHHRRVKQYPDLVTIVGDLRISRSTAFLWRKELGLGNRKTGPKGRK